jgi:hypothetical protein
MNAVGIFLIATSITINATAFVLAVLVVRNGRAIERRLAALKHEHARKP